MLNLDALGNLGEFIGALAVVVSILYLAIQIRQNTRALRGTAHETATARFQTFSLALWTHPESSRLFHRALNDPENLDPEERFRVNQALSSIFRGLETTYWQSRRGNVDNEIWESHRATLRNLMRSPGTREWWTSNANPTSKVFSDLVDRELDEVRGGPDLHW